MNQSVYFARCLTASGADMGAIKIGCSYGPEARVDTIGVQLPFTCELLGIIPGGMFTEEFLHMWLRDEKIRGEYFHARGETIRILNSVADYGRLPSDLRASEHNSNVYFEDIDALAFMRRNRVTFEETELVAGVSADYHRRLIEKHPNGNRRFVAALAVVMVKRGMAVSWPDDFWSRAKKASEQRRAAKRTKLAEVRA